jgi:acetyl esterase/lipase
MRMTRVEVSDEGLAAARELNEQIESFLATVPSTHLVPPEVTRRNRREGKGVMPAPVILDNGETTSCPGRGGGDIALRVFVPDEVTGVYLHIHGGGWTLGSAFDGDVGLWDIAQAAKVAVVSVEYGLAPERPFPAAQDDCEDAALWLLEKAEAMFGSTRLVIGGESAGAHLAAATLLRLRDNHGAADAFAGANLVYGCYDLSFTPSMARWGDRNLILSGPIVEWFCDLCTSGKSAHERRDPSISPLYADLTGLPPALFSVGDTDPLLDDSLFMAARWDQAGNDTELRVYPASIHGFDAFPTEAAKLSRAACAQFVAEAGR